jgi:hypothetical protein
VLEELGLLGRTNTVRGRKVRGGGCWFLPLGLVWRGVHLDMISKNQFVWPRLREKV